MDSERRPRERGVSPVIGVILMVAITVILAAVIAAFVLGVGETDEPAPQASLEYETSLEDVTGTGTPDSLIRISHESGDRFAAADVELSIDGERRPLLDAAANDFEKIQGMGVTIPTDIGPGDEIVLEAEDSGGAGKDPIAGQDDVEIQLIWSPEGSGQAVFSSERLDLPDTP
jgi:flagellin-like protein